MAAIEKLNNTHETTISTVENPAQTAARLLESQLDQERPRDPRQPPPRRPQAPDPGLIAGMAAAPSLGFPRARRIKQGRDFQRAKTQGKRVVHGCLIANWLPLPEDMAAFGSGLGAAVAGVVTYVLRRRTSTPMTGLLTTAK